MKTLKKVTIEPVYVEQVPTLSEMEDCKIYISEKYQTSLHKCLCGCGEEVVLPFDRPNGWNMIKEKDGAISFTPSIGNYSFDCRSHYIITRNVANFV